MVLIRDLKIMLVVMVDVVYCLNVLIKYVCMVICEF